MDRHSPRVHHRAAGQQCYKEGRVPERGPCFMDRVASLRSARGTASYLRQKLREEAEPLLPSTSSDEASTSSPPPLEQAEDSSDEEPTEPPRRHPRQPRPVLWEC